MLLYCLKNKRTQRVHSSAKKLTPLILFMSAMINLLKKFVDLDSDLYEQTKRKAIVLSGATGQIS